MYSHNISSWRQLYGIVFSKHFHWGNSTELYSQNISFKTTLRSRIIPKFLWGNSTELYYQNIHCKTTLWSCIPTFFFRATLRSCISSKHILWGNFAELYYQNISFEAILWNCILKIFSLGQLCGVVSPHFPLRELYIIVFSKHFFWSNSLELYSHTFLLGNSAEFYSQNIPFEAIL